MVNSFQHHDELYFHALKVLSIFCIKFYDIHFLSHMKKNYLLHAKLRWRTYQNNFKAHTYVRKVYCVTSSLLTHVSLHRFQITNPLHKMF